MARTRNNAAMALLEEIRAQLAGLAERVAALEQAALPAPAAVKPVAAAPATKPGITPEEVLAISAALAAYFGVKVRIRQIRLISSARWAQEGRVSIQASHRLHG